MPAQKRVDRLTRNADGVGKLFIADADRSESDKDRGGQTNRDVRTLTTSPFHGRSSINSNAHACIDFTAAAPKSGSSNDLSFMYAALPSAR
jgi:hypothetical protein